MYQILPYMEEGAITNLTRTIQLTGVPIPLYNCPSRRGITYLNGADFLLTGGLRGYRCWSHAIGNW